MDINDRKTCLQHLRKVLNSSLRAKDLVSQILTFSRQEEYEPTVVDLETIINETIKMLRASMPSTIEIRRTIETERPVIMADPTQMHQVLMNICTNAAYAMRDKGGILDLVLAEAVTDLDFSLQFPDHSPSDFLRLDILDTGHGMTPDVMERIFDPYFSTKEKGEGTGLGMATVLGIVQRHSGHITVNSEPEKGSQFQVYLPHAERQADDLSTSDSTFIPRGQRKDTDRG